MVRTKRQHRDFILGLLKDIDPSEVSYKVLPIKDLEDALRTCVKYLVFDKECHEREIQGWVETCEALTERNDEGGDAYGS